MTSAVMLFPSIVTFLKYYGLGFQHISWKARRAEHTLIHNNYLLWPGLRSHIASFFFFNYLIYLFGWAGSYCGKQDLWCSLQHAGGFPDGAVIKNPTANARAIGDVISILGLGNPLEKEMAAYSSILARIIPWAEKTGGLQFIRLQTEHASSRQNFFFLVVACGIFSWKVLVGACVFFSWGMQRLSCSMWNIVPWPEIQLQSLALRVLSLSHWTTASCLLYTSEFIQVLNFLKSN